MHRPAEHLQLSLSPLLSDATRTLAEAGVDAPRLDAQILVAHVLGMERLDLVRLAPEHPLTPEQRDCFTDLVAQRARRVPVAYLTGTRDFWTLTLRVAEGVLIPRPETELVVERALALVPGAGDIIDVGTGSGAIACALACELPQARVLARDVSRQALEVARLNTTRFAGITLEHGSLLEGVADACCDLLVSNPPYVCDGAWDELAPELHHEPRLALTAGPDGLALLRALIADAPRVLRPGSAVVLEHGNEQGAAVRALLAAAGLVDQHTARDLAGHERVTTGTRP